MKVKQMKAALATMPDDADVLFDDGWAEAVLTRDGNTVYVEAGDSLEDDDDDDDEESDDMEVWDDDEDDEDEE